MRIVASVAETTQGMPSSRLTMIAWLSAAPHVARLEPARVRRIEDHPGLARDAAGAAGHALDRLRFGRRAHVTPFVKNGVFSP
jgi:hypothetical protein